MSEELLLATPPTALATPPLPPPVDAGLHPVAQEETGLVQSGRGFLGVFGAEDTEYHGLFDFDIEIPVVAYSLGDLKGEENERSEAGERPQTHELGEPHSWSVPKRGVVDFDSLLHGVRGCQKVMAASRNPLYALDVARPKERHPLCPTGTYIRPLVVDHGLVRWRTGKYGIRVVFEVRFVDEVFGTCWTGTLTPKTIPTIIHYLSLMGWHGDDLFDLHQYTRLRLSGDTVAIRVGESKLKGFAFNHVYSVYKIGGLGQFNRIPEAEAAAVGVEWRHKLIAARSGRDLLNEDAALSQPEPRSSGEKE